MFILFYFIHFSFEILSSSSFLIRSYVQNKTIATLFTVVNSLGWVRRSSIRKRFFKEK